MALSVEQNAAAQHRSPPVEGRPRLAYLDNLKTTLVAAIIAGHAAITYGALGDWIYTDKTSSSMLLTGVSLLAVVCALFAVGAFFLISGMLTPVSLQRKGPMRFSTDRLMRLGVPLLVYAVVLMPAIRYVVALVRTEISPHDSIWSFYLHQITIRNVGPMWFVAFLLVFSLVYAWAPHHPTSPAASPLSIRRLVILAGLIAAGSALLRLAWPFDPRQAANLHVGLWVQYPLMFWFGARLGESGASFRLDDRLWRRLGIITLSAALTAGVLVAFFSHMSAANPVVAVPWPWPDLALALLEGALAVSGSLFLLDLYRRHVTSTNRLSVESSRNAYVAFVLQAPVLVGVALALHPLDLAPEVKFLILAPTAVMGSFLLAQALRAGLASLSRSGTTRPHPHETHCE